METSNIRALEIRELWRRYKDSGDKYAREQLVLAFSPLVKYVAGRMSTGLPAHVEVAEELDMSLDDFQDSLTRISNSSVIALDELWTLSDSSGDQVSLLDTIQDPDAIDPAHAMDATETKDRLADAIARLPEREKLVVALYYYENLTLREIGEVLGVTESRVSQLHTKAVLRLKSRLQTDILEGAG